MNNKRAKEYWGKMAANNPTPKTVKVTSCSDFTHLDADFIMKYADKNSEILDLASGSGLIINKIIDKVKKMVAVELYEGFSQYIQKADNIKVVHESIDRFETDEIYDLITMFGISQYFNCDEIKQIYKKYLNNLKETGKLIIKNQFGVKEDVDVSGYSEELKENYYSQYRHIDKEVKILETIGYKNIEIVDIYPPECNRWENTHFYAIVAEK
jgi:cyclopropane fatty-acyl-phospholipid synthase-like methyltransferase